MSKLKIVETLLSQSSLVHSDLVFWHLSDSWQVTWLCQATPYTVKSSLCNLLTSTSLLFCLYFICLQMFCQTRDSCQMFLKKILTDFKVFWQSSPRQTWILLVELQNITLYVSLARSAFYSSMEKRFWQLTYDKWHLLLPKLHFCKLQL